MSPVSLLAISAFVALAALPYKPEQVEPQPLPEGVKDTGINVLFDSSHQYTFFMHWNVQGVLRDSGHRVTGNQAALHHALTPGTPMRVRDQHKHSWSEGRLQRPFVMLPAPEYDVCLTYQSGQYQPYLPEEKKVLEQFVLNGGGLIMMGGRPDTPLGELAASYGVRVTDKRRKVKALVEVPGAEGLDLRRRYVVGEVGDEWQVLIGDAMGRAALARRQLGKGVVVWLSDEWLLHQPEGKRTKPNAELLSWLVSQAAGGPKQRQDERRIPWEYGGIGGAFYPENEIKLRSVSVFYADNQLPDIVELARTKFPEVLKLLQKMLPTPPNPGGDFYIILSAGAGGGWAENVYTPKLAGVISRDHNSILSILAHELTHTMYGPEAKDGTPGCSLPGWFSEAHAGWFQRKVGREMGFGPRWPYYDHGLARQDPLLDAIDLANIKEGQMGLAWHKAWLIWSLLDARYGESWYPKWLAHIHRKYNDPSRKLSMDEYVKTISETVGEDVAPLFERFGTTLGPDARTNLPPIGPR
ncbi:MAG: hypothetical protein J7M26_09560 [Armatimonadetes bacterium]|nr:hypothetical protein [Armatimonadota bacterium]